MSQNELARKKISMGFHNSSIKFTEELGPLMNACEFSLQFRLSLVALDVPDIIISVSDMKM